MRWPTGKLRLFEYHVLIHPPKAMEQREPTTLHKEGRILQKNEQCAMAAIISQLPDDLKENHDCVEVGLRPF